MPGFNSEHFVVSEKLYTEKLSPQSADLLHTQLAESDMLR